ncbi:MAG: mannitol-1-phosphate 5-dehydrogenase [Kiritimatiellae bacterium]|nr:mannitol-1-phosphate 5-dehydrogenase [Kiritimatiellia bacterium]
MPLYVHFGAGNIGRALAGPIFSQAGYDLLFVDAFQPVVDALQKRRGYQVIVKDDLPPGAADVINVTGVGAISAHDADAVADAILRADLIGTAVGSANMPALLQSMVPGILARKGAPLSILLCENFNGVAEFAREYLTAALPENFQLNKSVGFVETSIGKMVPIMPAAVRQHDPLALWAEAYNKIIADRNGFVGHVPANIEGLELKDCFQAYVERKLYIHNLGHATCACYGFQKKYSLICDAIGDSEILAATRRVMDESAAALIKRWPSEFNQDNQRAHVEDLIKRFGNRALGDTIFRVGRDLARKLAPGDRFIGALRLVQQYDGDCSVLYKAIAAALRFKAADESGKMFPADAAFHERLKQEGPEQLLQAHCGLTEEECQKVIVA